MTNGVGSDAYNQYSGLSDYPYNCIAHMMENNEMIWKLLNYNDSDAYKENDLTKEEKGSLVYDGSDKETDFRVFMDQGQSDAWIKESCVLRISIFRVIPDNRTVGTVKMLFEVYSHYKINHLSNYKTRIDLICEELLKTFNGSEVGGMGKFFYNVTEDNSQTLSQSGQVPFKGKKIIMSAKIA